MNAPALYLASRSPRRKELLQQMGVDYAVVDVDISEEALPGESPAAMAQRLANEKSQAGWQALAKEGVLVLGGDTLVDLDGEVFGKPDDAAHAAVMLAKLAGRTHVVYSAVAMNNGRQQAGLLNCSKVTFANMTLAEIEDYVALGEYKGRAAGYAVQGMAALFIKYIEGSYSGIIGLPLFETGQLLRKFSVPFGAGL